MLDGEVRCSFMRTYSWVFLRHDCLVRSCKLACMKEFLTLVCMGQVREWAVETAEPDFDSEMWVSGGGGLQRSAWARI